MKSKCHEFALELESSKPSEERDPEIKITRAGPTQARVDVLAEKSSRSGYLRLMTTAYSMALHPTMPLHHFGMLIQTQRKNGVKFISGNHNGRTAKALVESIDKAVTEKVRKILNDSPFMSLLTDGSQARKTGDDKEMMLARVERNGGPAYLMASLLQMSKFGGTGAQATKDAIDSVFKEGGILELNDFVHKLIGSTADGASVNFGAYGGLLKKLEDEGRPWLVKIHCVNHRTELAVKDAFKDSVFKTVDSFYIGVFYLLKNSGAIKSDIKGAAESLGISFYTLPKMTGTRFVSHRKKALTHLLHMWPAIIAALDNTLVARQHKAETKAKIQGFLKQLRSYAFLCLVCTYLDILEKITLTSLIFEGNGLLPFEVEPTIKMTVIELQDVIDSSGTDDELLDSHLSRFQYFTDEDGVTKLASSFAKTNHMLRDPQNREYISVDFENFTKVNDDSTKRASNVKKQLAVKLIAFLKHRFTSFNDPVFKNMQWFDPKNWSDDSNYGKEQVQDFANHFSEVLTKTTFSLPNALLEWKKLKAFVSASFGDQLRSNKIDAKGIWKHILCYRKSQFSNLSLLAQIIVTLSGSNSSVERSFSVLTSVLTDRRLKMSHATLEMLIRIYSNDKVWSEIEREEIISRATDIHLDKRRRLRMDADGNPEKRPRITEEISDESSSESDSSSSGAESSESAYMSEE